MLLFLLSDRIRFPLLGYILNGVYYALIAAGILVCAFLIRRRLIAFNFPARKIDLFIYTGVPLAVCSGYVGSRAANMFHHSPELWSLPFFLQQFADARMQTFHGALLMPIIVLSLLILALHLNFGRVWDAIFLYIPIGHAFGRAGCFLAGCCWGRPVHIDIFGRYFSFPNPVPLYAIILNLLLFVLLKARFNAVYSRPESKSSGLIVGIYLAGYGGIRFVLEIIRKESVLALGLTQAQFVSAGFMAAGALLIGFILAGRNLWGTRPEWK